MASNRQRGGKLRYVDTTEPEDFIPNFGDIDPNNITLTELADIHGSDKGSLKHNYCLNYEKIIKDICDSRQVNKNQLNINLLEIGVACGASLRTWSHYLPQSQITGLDVRHECQQLCRDLNNVEILIADATSQEQLNRITSRNKYDIIVDDGSHVSEHISASFKFLWESVRPGGYYAIEDLACTYNKSYTSHIKRAFNIDASNKRETILELLDLVLKACDKHFYKISSLHYFPQLLIIKKEF